MASVCYGGYIRMNPEVEEETRDPMFDGGYPYSIPKVYLDGVGESYFPQWCFNWDNDSVVVVRDKHVVKYTKSVYLELLAKNEAGEIVWMDGRTAPYSGCWDGEYLNEERGAQEYTVEEYDFEKFEKRKYKVILDETSKFDANNLHGVYGFLDSEVVGSDFIIVDGALTKYIGESSNLIIPDGVIEIHYNPFASVHDFDLISIPKTLVKIPGDVFRECTAKNINVDKDNPKYYTKDGCLIDRETGTLVWAFTATNIPDDNSIKNIASYAFARRDDLKSVVIPDSVQTINYSAFWKCDSLKEICTSGVGIDVSEVILGKSYIRKGDEWTVNISACGRSNSSFAGFCF